MDGKTRSGVSFYDMELHGVVPNTTICGLLCVQTQTKSFVNFNLFLISTTFIKLTTKLVIFRINTIPQFQMINRFDFIKLINEIMYLDA